MTKNRVELALIARGVDTAQARTLRADGWTVAKLKKSSELALMKLGFPPEIIQSLLHRCSPIIPFQVLFELLSANRWSCCICNLSERPVVVHPIVSWASGGDLSLRNLAILCTYHKDEACSVRGLDGTLTADRLAAAKQAWEARADGPDLVALKHRSKRLGELNWWYYGHKRLCEVVGAHHNLTQLPGFQAAFTSGACDKDGHPVWPDDRAFLYYGEPGLCLYTYMWQVLFEFVGKFLIKDVSDKFMNDTSPGTLANGDVICVQGQHTFHHHGPATHGVRMIRGVVTIKKVEITYVFDLNEGTSELARTTWLRGARVLSSIILVSMVKWIGSKCLIRAEVLAIRSLGT